MLITPFMNKNRRKIRGSESEHAQVLTHDMRREFAICSITVKVNGRTYKVE